MPSRVTVLVPGDGGGLHQKQQHQQQHQQQASAMSQLVIKLEFDNVTVDFPVPNDSTLMLSDLRAMIKQQRDRGGFPTSFLFEYDYPAGGGGSSSSSYQRARVFQSLECKTPLQQCLLKSQSSRLYLRRTAVEPPGNNPPPNPVVTPVASKTTRKTNLKGTLPSSSTASSTSATIRSTSLNRGTKRKKTTKPSPSASTSIPSKSKSKSKSKKAPPRRHQISEIPTHRLMLPPQRFEFTQPSTALFVHNNEQHIRKVKRILERDYVEDTYNSRQSPASYLYKIEWEPTETTSQTQDRDGDGGSGDNTGNGSYTKVAYKNMSADLQKYVRERSWSDRFPRRRGGSFVGSTTRHDKSETSPSSSTDRWQKDKDNNTQKKPLSSVVVSFLADKLGEEVVENQLNKNDRTDDEERQAVKKYLSSVVASLLDDNLDDEDETMTTYNLCSSKQEEEEFEI